MNVRLAADAVGATKMDRCEDVEPHPTTGRIYVACTNNTDRGQRRQGGGDRGQPARQREPRRACHRDHRGAHDATATTFGWSILLLCGDPAVNGSTYFAGFPADQVSPISCPDNVAFDSEGNLSISTDGAPGVIGYGDGLFKVPLEGRRARSRPAVPLGAARGRDLRSGDPRSRLAACSSPCSTRARTARGRRSSSFFPDYVAPGTLADGKWGGPGRRWCRR